MKMSNISQTFQDDYKNCKKKKSKNNSMEHLSYCGKENITLKRSNIREFYLSESG